MRLRIAIDGPAGAGKSTVSSRVAAALGLPKLDTGAIYRTLALAAKRAGISWDDADALAGLARTLPLRFAGNAAGAPLQVYLADEEVTSAIRTPEMSQGSSLVSRHPPVRAALLPVQRRLAADGVVAEGRDIGSVVLPDAEVKIFLTASPLERARRRQAEMRTQGVERTVEDVLVEQNARDERDTTRATAPLRAADDATIVDTDRLTLEQVVARILEVVAERFDTHSGTM